jgi:hypothetical protein
MRQASNALLRRYFESLGCALDLDWDELPEGQIQPLYEEWLKLDDATQRATDALFTSVHELANDAGVAVLIEEGGWHSLDLATEFAAFDDPYDMVLWTAMERPRVFDVASLFRAADRIGERSWRKLKGLPLEAPRDDASARTELESALSAYFVREQGRGRNCTVEVYQRSGDFYFFAFIEDYARAEQDYVAGKLVRVPHSRAFQVVFVFAPTRGTLDASAPGGRPVVAKLMDIATSTLLGTAVAEPSKDDRIYELEGLRDEGFAWKYAPNAGISDVWVKAMRLSLKTGGERLIAEGTKHGEAHRLYNRVVSVSASAPGLRADATFVTQVEVRVEYAPRNGRKVRPRDFRVTYPNSCSLGHDDADRVLREMLISSGVDPAAIGRDAKR